MSKVKHSHPPGLYVLFSAEMWERLSYYGMRGLLVLYMTKEFMFSDQKAYGVYASYTALVYATPVLGGLIADRLLGYRKAVMLGGILMAVGHFAMAFENHSIFYLALALIIMGNGFFKPNISTIVGALYADGDRRRDAGFTIFYMGINIGAFCQLFAGLLGERVGWHWGFGLAGVGMLVGLLIFWLGQDKLEGKAEPPDPEKLKEYWIPGINKEYSVYLGTLVGVGIAWFLVQDNSTVGVILKIVGGVCGIGLVWYAFFKCTIEERDKMLVALALITLSVVFWAFFEQAGSSMNLFTDRNVDRVVFGWEAPTSFFQSVNPFFIIIFAAFFSMMWIRLAEKDKEPSIPVKFALGIIQLGLGFGALYYGTVNADADGKVALIWLILGYLFHTTGELCLSPIGLSMITKLSPKRIGALMMGIWFLATAFAQYMAGLIAMLTGVSEGGEEGANAIPDPTQTVLIYGDVFGKIAIAAIVTGVLALLLAPLLKKRMHGVN